MIKRTALILLIVVTSQFTYAQQKEKIKIDLSNSRQKIKNVEQVQNRSKGFVLTESIASIEIFTEDTKDGFYGKIVSDGMSKTYDSGNPDLPVINRLIEIPPNSEVKIKILNYDEEVVDLNNYGFDNKIIPAQPSHHKSQDLKKVPFVKNDKVYHKNEFYKKKLVKFEDKGYLRNKHLGYIEISPFIYNPVSNVLKVLNNLEVEISFIPASKHLKANKSNLNSDYFNSINYPTINQIQEAKTLVSGPVKYVIVADRMFEETLQDFVLWKTQKGFVVVEAYTDDIGGSTTEIKTYLQELYENPADGISPTFALLVGDVAQIPAFDGNAGGHKTDLYYFEYTGDKLPEVFYGRFSAETIAELQPQIDKTLEIEKYQMPDPAYLDNVVLVAGVDGTYAPTHGNGAINYANNYYTNSSSGINSYYYLFGDDSGVMASDNSGASESVRNNISAGASFSNYTAHCGISGWSDPGFNSGNIDALTNNHMYPLMIGNCCESNTFNYDDCFGEKLLMAANKGAVGYIGGSNLTYWDEDYYWGIGLTGEIIANPTYENSGLGAYDRFFHLNGESKTDWYVTQGQINVAGNLAVEASTSTRKAYYWEIYHLMGDPSLTPFVTVPSVLTATYNNEMVVSTTTFEVATEENAYVAISLNGELLDAQLVGASGVVELNFDGIGEVGTADIVITKQNRQPLIDEITITPSNSPYILAEGFTIDDSSENNDSAADYGESIKLDVLFKNYSDKYDAFNVNAKLTTIDTNIIIIDSLQAIGDVAIADSLLSDDAFSIQLKNKFFDQYEIKLNIAIDGEDSLQNSYSWESDIRIIVDAPKLVIEELFIDDSAESNDSTLNPGEMADLSLIVKNTGNSDISDLNGTVSILGEGSSYLTLNTIEAGPFVLEKGQTDTLKFNVTAKNDVVPGTVIYLRFEINDAFSYYGTADDKFVSIGEIPEILISDDDTSLVSLGYFYDTGGKKGNYSDSENEVITIRSKDPNKSLMAEFLSFSVEKDGTGCYDYLKIYDGVTVSEDSLIGVYCDSNVPEMIVATNEKGALTFSFNSDGSFIQNGWEAKVQSYVGYDIEATIVDPAGVIENATIEIGGTKAFTNSLGKAWINNIPEGINIPVRVYADNHKTLETTINIFENSSETFNLEYEQYNVAFNLSDKNGVIEGTVTMEDRTLQTRDGFLVFDEVVYGLINKEYSISTSEYGDTTGTFNLVSDTTLEIHFSRYDVAFVISDGKNPINNACVVLDEDTVYTNQKGEALFDNLSRNTNVPCNISKTHYKDINGTVDINGDLMIDTVLSAKSYNISFKIMSDALPLAGAVVEFDNAKSTTNANGICSFMAEYALSQQYGITLSGYKDETGTVDVDEYKTLEIWMSKATGIDDIKEKAIHIYPNPSDGLFNIEINSIPNKEVSIKIFNAIGSNIYTERIFITSEMKKQVDLSNYPKGIYIVSIESENGIIGSKRLIVK